MPVKAGSITVDGASRIRRRGTLTLVGDNRVYEICAEPGATFSIMAGLNLGTTNELVPLLFGEAEKPAQAFGDGTISVGLADLGGWLSRTRFVAPYTPASTLPRVDAITAVVLAARPGTS